LRLDKNGVAMNMLRSTALFAIAFSALAQSRTNFKQTRIVRSTEKQFKRRSIDRFHAFIEAGEALGGNFREQLETHGIHVLSALPEGLLLVSAPDGTAFEEIGVIESSEVPVKISPELDGLEDGAFVVVEFHSDTSAADADSILLGQNLEIQERPDMLPNQRLVRGTSVNIRSLENWDEVSYVFPASSDLIAGLPVIACAGALTDFGPLGQYIATVGSGWDGPGLGSANLTYSYSQLTAALPRETTTAILQRALAEWAKYARLTFTYSDNTAGTRNINFLFASGAHGDPYPFDGPGKILAHTFYPTPVNPDPIAGDMHLDADEHWQAGADIDLFSVVLHEVGHALGLGHSDKASAVMYPYYKRVTALTTEDVAAVRTLYAPQADGAVAPAALSITATAPSSTSAATVDLSGTTAGGSGEVRVTLEEQQRRLRVCHGRSQLDDFNGSARTRR
jgi:Predicted Zn-dependent proteases